MQKTTEQEELPISVGYASAQMRPHAKDWNYKTEEEQFPANNN
jgi:hypothetical protein